MHNKRVPTAEHVAIAFVFFGFGMLAGVAVSQMNPRFQVSTKMGQSRDIHFHKSADMAAANAPLRAILGSRPSLNIGTSDGARKSAIPPASPALLSQQGPHLHKGRKASNLLFGDPAADKIEARMRQAAEEKKEAAELASKREGWTTKAEMPNVPRNLKNMLKPKQSLWMVCSEVFAAQVYECPNAVESGSCGTCAEELAGCYGEPADVASGMVNGSGPSVPENVSEPVTPQLTPNHLDRSGDSNQTAPVAQDPVFSRDKQTEVPPSAAATTTSASPLESIQGMVDAANGDAEHCPHECSGRGVCDEDSGQCLCRPGVPEPGRSYCT
jgi:hypothetical protein